MTTALDPMAPEAIDRRVSGRMNRRAGITLVEVLAAIFIMGVGLLALLTLFPLGALSMAQEIEDDRAAHIAQEAVALSQVGEDVLAETRDFVFTSFKTGSTDPKAVLNLRQKYQALLEQAIHIESEIRDLRDDIASKKDLQRLNRILEEIQLIEERFYLLVQLLLLLEHGL